MHITQAAVSRQIRGLEDNLGVKLFYRRNRAVSLTQEGRDLARVVSDALHSIGDSAALLRAAQRSDRVVLLCQLCEAFYWLMPRLSSFHQQYPHLDIQVVTSTRPLTEFSAHFDVALQSSRRPSGPHPLMFTAADEVFTVCSPAYFDARQPLSLTELQSATFLHHSSQPPHLMEWDSWLQVFGQTVAVNARSATFDSYPLMLQAAVEGHGVAMGWRRTASRLIESGALVRPCVESVHLPEAISIYRHQGAGDRPEIAALLGWLQEQLKGDS